MDKNFIVQAVKDAFEAKIEENLAHGIAGAAVGAAATAAAAYVAKKKDDKDDAKEAKVKADKARRRERARNKIKQMNEAELLTAFEAVADTLTDEDFDKLDERMEQAEKDFFEALDSVVDENDTEGFENLENLGEAAINDIKAILEETIKVEATIRGSDKTTTISVKSLKELRTHAASGKYDGFTSIDENGEEVEFTVSEKNKLIKV